MVEKQLTFGNVLGMEPVVPTRLHPNDLVECSDGSTIAWRDAFTDCRGDYHSTDDSRKEANVAIVTEILDDRLKGAEEYCRENEDYGSGYSCIVDECHFNWPDRVKDWVIDGEIDYDDWKRLLVEHEDEIDHTSYDEWAEECDSNEDYDPPCWSDFVDEHFHKVTLDNLVYTICDDLDGSSDCELVFGNNEYAIYDGPGCYLDGFDIGEVEEQVGISDYPEFEVLHKCGELDDCLDEYDGYACINRSKRRVKNEKTGHYEEVGRNTYDTHGSDYPTFEFYHSPGGRWDFVVPDDRMNDLLQEALIELFEKEVL